MSSAAASPTLPLRNPDAGDREMMTRRAWWLVVANFLIPGAGSTLGGNRRLGRFMLGFWLVNLALVVVLAVLALTLRGPLLFALSTQLGLTIAAIYLFVVGVLWAISGLDTLRLTRMIRVDPLARGLISMIAIVCMAVPLLFAGWAAGLANQAKSLVGQLFGGPAAGVALPADGRYNVLVLGGDTGPDRDGTRPDSISVMSFDALSGRLLTVGVPRNMESFTFADGPMRELYPDGYEDCEVDVCYLNSVYTEVSLKDAELYPDAEERGSNAGIEATKDAVESITGLPIHYYVMIDMQGFADLVDALGGVDIDVKERVGLGINDDGSPGWEPPSTFIEPGYQHMDGEIALWYARSRYETTDFARMERQRQLQEAILAKFTPQNLLSRLGPVSDAIAKVVSTDIPEGMAGIFADLALKSRGGNSVRLDLVPPLIDIEAPDMDVTREAVQQALKTDPHATATSSPTALGVGYQQEAARDPKELAA
ncbi:Polyisoprenyl-teichoic acid--peptidoglycan teichoic acid transferase TagV [Pseudoclavibacter triregionum]|nr:Polyisoprenyl-teichoic acid--peptidoglycan teichoic acid transferase TagV [Pseudoclavibacter triregionum]